MSPSLAVRLSDYTVTESGCWEWSGSVDSKGYGRFRDTKAHRIAYEEWVGPIPEGHVVRHRCDNPLCINPEHLRTGTHAQNVEDRVERGRSAKGENHGWSKLTQDKVVYIREQYAAGGRSQQSIADEVGISQVHVSDIVRRIVWAHV